MAIETNRYSVPAHLMGQALTARIHAERVELFAGPERVAVHARGKGQHARIIDPAHFEAAFTSKPRGRVMVYRDWLCSLSPVVLQLHGRTVAQTPQRAGRADALRSTNWHGKAGRPILSPRWNWRRNSRCTAPNMCVCCWACHRSLRRWVRRKRERRLLELPVPAQHEVERDLAQYEHYVANREQVLELASTPQTGARA